MIPDWEPEPAEAFGAVVRVLRTEHRFAARA